MSETASQPLTRPDRAASEGCRWCGAPLDPMSERRPGRVRCATCGSWSTSPVPTDAELDAAYGRWYRPSEGRFSGPGDALFSRLRGTLARRLDRIAPAGPILDVGAGDASLLGALRDRGREATGIDLFSAHPAVLHEEIEDKIGPYAGVVFWHSLEHLRQPDAALRHAASIVQPGGIVVVAMPNVSSLQAGLFGDRWFALDLPRHLVHVPARALTDRLSGIGLEVERVSYLRGGQAVFGWLQGLVGSLPGHPDLYDAIRRPEARRAEVSAPARLASLTAAGVLLPVAGLGAAAEAAARRGGSVYVEARLA